MNEPFVQLPHWVSDYTETADLNMTQFRIINVVIRQTFGFHQQWAHFTQRFLSLRTNCNQRQIARELKSLVEKGVLLEKYKGKERLLCINPALANEGYDHTPQQDGGYDSLDIPEYDSLDIDRYDSSDTHKRNSIKEKEKEKNNTSHLHATAHFLKEYDSNIKEGIEDAIIYYYTMYKERKEKNHPKLKQDQLIRIYEWFEENIYAYGDMEDMIEEFFNTVKQTDYNINHFCTDGMIQVLVDRCR